MAGLAKFERRKGEPEGAGQGDANLPIVALLDDGPREFERAATAGAAIQDAELSKPAETPLKVFVASAWRAVALGAWIPLRTCGRYLRRHPLHALLNLLMCTVLGLLMVTGSEIHTQMILGQMSDQTIDRIIESSRFTREFDAEDVATTGARELVGVGAPSWIQRQSVRAILFHARKAGLSIEDQAVLLATADVESGFNPFARAPTTTACGVFQFVRRTGEMFSLPHKDCMDPWLNAKAAVAHYQQNFDRRVREKVAGLTGTERVFRSYELSYYLHHDGPESSNPSNEVKATVLNGTQFLFAAYHALKEESESRVSAPTFAEQFQRNAVELLDTIRSSVTEVTGLFGLPEANAAETAAPGGDLAPGAKAA